MINRQHRWDDDWLALIEFWAKRKSKDPSTKVGAVIVRPDHTVCSLGYNGFPRGIADDDRLTDREAKYPRIIHAERNAMLFAKEPLAGFTLYTWPFEPCAPCAAMIIQAGIKRIVAPHPSDALMARWGSDLEIARAMYEEVGIELRLV